VSAGEGPTPVAASDADTVAYFDSHVPDYDPGRLEITATYLREHASAGSTLIDLGCGVGNTLAFLAEETPIKTFTALDVSQNCLDQTKALVECTPVLGSAVDPAVADGLRDSFDFAVLSAVLHHLVGPTRKQSRQNAVDAVRNALTMLKPDGTLIIHEPVFEPKLAMDAVFWAKRGLSRVSGNRRVPILGYWGNLGAPVVSYYSDDELGRLIAEGRGRIVEHHKELETLDGVMDKLLDRASVTVAVRAI
jgi:SAM-dependent methyltransferase